MADQEHLDILTQGIDAWNAWRLQHPNIRPNLSGAELAGMRLRGPDPVRANLAQADLRGADLTKAGLRSVSLDGTDLRETRLKADLREAWLSRADLRGADLRGALLRQAHFTSADLSNANFAEVSASDVDFNYARLDEATLIEADLWDTKFYSASLRRARLREANLPRCNLTRACLVDADLSEASLVGANLTLADLRGATLRGARLIQANFTGARLERADFTQASIGLTQLTYVDVRNVRGLETVVHEAPSSLGIETLLRAKGALSEDFLRKAGVPEDFIIYLRTLSVPPRAASICCLLQALEQMDFGVRLLSDLRASGVRCWAIEDDYMIQESINEALCLYDHFLLALSQEAVSDPRAWVKYAVESVRAREEQEGRPILIPIVLDEAVLEQRADWIERLQESRRMVRFVDWNNQAAYEEGVKQVLQELE